MKNLKSTLALALLLIGTMSSFARTNHIDINHKDSNSIMDHYVQATTLGTIALDEMVLADDFNYTVNNTKFNKKQYAAFLQKNNGLAYDCTTHYEIVEKTGDVSIAKITMNFATFTRVDYVTLHTIEGQWKVSEIVTSYK